MRSRLSALLLLSWCVGLPTGVVGCSRSTVVAPAEAVPARAEASPVGRAKAPAADPEPVREKLPAEPQGFRFPDDPGGALLAKVLSPGEASTSTVEKTSGPRRLP